MADSTLSERIAANLRAMSLIGYRILLSIAWLLAVGSMLIASYKLGYREAEEAVSILHSLPTASDSMLPDFLNVMRISIAIAFIICFSGFWLRNAFGFILSMLALIWVFMAYLWWRSTSLAFLRGAEVANFPADLPHAGGLHSATWWDMVVLTITATLFLWMIKLLMRSMLKISNVDRSAN